MNSKTERQIDNTYRIETREKKERKERNEGKNEKRKKKEYT